MTAFRIAPLVLLCLALAGCGGADKPRPARILDTPQSAETRSGDLVVRAEVVRTAQLNPAMAQRYGIARSDDGAMLIVSVRKGPEGRDTSPPSSVTARYTDLQGQSHDVALHAANTGALRDDIGTFDVSAPDTLRFEVTATPEGAAPMTLQFTREFPAE